MKLPVLLIPSAVLLLTNPTDPIQAKAEKPRSSEELVADVVKGTDRKSSLAAAHELVQRIERGGDQGDMAAKLLLGRREEITDEPGVKALLDGLMSRDKAATAARILVQIARAKGTVATYKRGHVAVGRVVLADGKLDPELVLAQMEILPEGYFAGEVGDLERPIGFRAEGYLGLDVPLKGKAGPVVHLGTITLQPLPAGQASSVKGKVILDDARGSDSATVHLSLDVPRPNTPHSGFSTRRRWPEPIIAPVSKAGEFRATRLTPGNYTMIVDAKGHVRSFNRVILGSGRQEDVGTINLQTNDIGFYLGKTAPPTRALAWEKDYPSAITKAKAEKKPLMIMMTATWCGPCKMLEKETLDDPWVRYFLSNFVVVKAYEDKAVENAYGLNAYPTLVFADCEGREVSRTVGYQATIPFSGACAKAFENLGMKRPPELQELVAKKVVTPDRR